MEDTLKMKQIEEELKKFKQTDINKEELYEIRINTIYSKLKRKLKNLKKYSRKNKLLKEKTRVRSGLLNFSDAIDSFFSILKQNEKNLKLLNKTEEREERLRIYGYIEVSLSSLEKKIEDFIKNHNLNLKG